MSWDHSVVTFQNSLTAIAGYRIIAIQSAFNISDIMVEVPRTQDIYTFPSVLEEFTMYTCKVYAKNSFGYGEPSQAVKFKTLPDG